jgi:hypothetical protein
MGKLLLWMMLGAAAATPQDPFVVAADHYKLELDNPWVRVVRVTYGPYEKAPMHDHPSNPSVYIYLNNAGPLKFSHGSGVVTERGEVVAGAIRFNRGSVETHEVENLGKEPSEYLRVELRTEPLDLIAADVRISATAPVPSFQRSVVFENGQLRIVRATCPGGQDCSYLSTGAEPAIVVLDGKLKWLANGVDNFANKGPNAIEQIRLELKSKPLNQGK